MKRWISRIIFAARKKLQPAGKTFRLGVWLDSLGTRVPILAKELLPETEGVPYSEPLENVWSVLSRYFWMVLKVHNFIFE